MIDMYDSIAFYYKSIVEPRNHFCQQVNVLIEIMRKYCVTINSKILDAACGTGDVAVSIYDKGFERIHAVDGSSEMLLKTSKTYQSKLLFKCYLWKELDLFFKKYGHYQLVYIMGHSLPHSLQKDICQIFGNIYNGLEKNGIFVFDVRKWIHDDNGILIQPFRPIGIFRELGELEIDGIKYKISDKVAYNNKTQLVTYQVVDLVSKEICKEFTLAYSIFDDKEAFSMLLDAGFKKSNISINKYDLWSYNIIECTK